MRLGRCSSPAMDEYLASCVCQAHQVSCDTLRDHVRQWLRPRRIDVMFIDPVSRSASSKRMEAGLEVFRHEARAVFLASFRISDLRADLGSDGPLSSVCADELNEETAPGVYVQMIHAGGFDGAPGFVQSGYAVRGPAVAALYQWISDGQHVMCFPRAMEFTTEDLAFISSPRLLEQKLREQLACETVRVPDAVRSHFQGFLPCLPVLDPRMPLAQTSRGPLMLSRACRAFDTGVLDFEAEADVPVPAEVIQQLVWGPMALE